MIIAKRKPFDGVPRINTPLVFGISDGKEFLYRIPVIGKRPIKLSLETEEAGICLENGILRGKVCGEKEFAVTVIAENELGRTEKKIRVVCEKWGVGKTPLLGFTSWNAFGAQVTQTEIEITANDMVNSGVADYGYYYVNLDSGWQEKYGGKYDAIMPNGRFPDLQKMCDTIHSLGMRAGIYSTPMLTAWGCPSEFSSIPGCTQGEADPRFPEAMNGGIGMIHKEKNNVKQWEEWGFDYLKYDWTPTDAVNADLMRRELAASKREFCFCVTVNAVFSDAEYWSKNVNSWRANKDTYTRWDNVLERTTTLDTWADYSHAGHFYDLDMLAMDRYCGMQLEDKLTHEEEIFQYTMMAFFNSPIQISTPISTLTEDRLDIICNEEMIEINQDSLCDYPRPVKKDEKVLVYKRKLACGDTAYAIFNISDENITETLDIEDGKTVRDVWLKENIRTANRDGKFYFDVEAHCVRVFRISEK